MKVAIAGAGGRMGRTLIEAVLADREFVLACAFDVPGSPAVGQEVGNIHIGSDPKAAAAADVLIDFTRPEGTLENLRHARAMVIGTTGFSQSQKKAIEEAAKRLPMVMAANFAVVVNAAYKLAETAARILGDGYDVEIIEAHHRHKVDAPSGTALQLGEVIAKALNRSLAEVARHGRQGDTGERPATQIGFHAVRGGDIVGEHTVLFAGPGERLTLSHSATDRAIFARGALQGARWLHGQRPGRYSMRDILSYKSYA